VILRAVIDRPGGSSRHRQDHEEPNPAFDQPTKDWVLKALFRPARLHGRGVRVFIKPAVDYSLTPAVLVCRSGVASKGA